MNREEIKTIVINSINKLCKHKNISNITEKSHLELDLGIDSLNKVELASDLLDEMGLEDIDIEKIAEIYTIGQVIDFFESMINKGD